MVKMTHLAAQYLAAAGISFLHKKEDDSHTSLLFTPDEGRLSTWPLNEQGHTLSLNYNTFNLEWDTKTGKEVLHLEGKNHDEVLKWILTQSSNSSITRPYIYKFHYELPYQINDGAKFELDPLRLQEQLYYRSLGQLAIESFLIKVSLKSNVRIWPHHFDTGAYIPNIGKDKDFALGVGLAIPDDLHSDFYFYMSMYDGHGSLSTKNLKALSKGQWSNSKFKGAILPIADATNEDMVVQFFDEAFNSYKDQYDL